MDDVIGQRQWDRMSIGTNRQCVSVSRSTGERCKKAPIVGGFVCATHGGRHPEVIKSARERLLAMVDPALDALLRFLRTAPPCTACGRSDADRDPTVLRAAQIVLDRTGYHPTLGVQVDTPNPFENLSEDELIARLECLLAEAKARRAQHVRVLPAANTSAGCAEPQRESNA